jgi:hypothetical protein
MSKETPLLWNHKRIYSFGAGTQSIAVMVAQAQGLLKEPYDYFVWADVGYDSEDPKVHNYMADYVMPFCQEHGIQMIRVAKKYKGKEDTVLRSVLRPNRSIPIPVRMKNGAPGNRSCTFDFKIKQVDDWCKRKGLSHATIGIGFSLDEVSRTVSKNMQFLPHNKRSKNNVLYRRYDFPLLELQFSRLQSIRLVEKAGLPTPPSSACWFCPFKHRHVWIEDKKHRPEIVQRTAIVEAIINKKRSSIGRDHVYIHPPTGGRMHKMPNAIGDQMSLFEETCESGYCGL